MCNCQTCKRQLLTCDHPCTWCENTMPESSCLPTPCTGGCEDSYNINCVLTDRDFTVCGIKFKAGSRLPAVINAILTGSCFGGGGTPTVGGGVLNDYFTVTSEEPIIVPVAANDTITCGGSISFNIVYNHGVDVDPASSIDGLDFSITPWPSYTGIAVFYYEVLCDSEVIDVGIVTGTVNSEVSITTINRSNCCDDLCDFSLDHYFSYKNDELLKNGVIFHYMIVVHDTPTLAPEDIPTGSLIYGGTIDDRYLITNITSVKTLANSNQWYAVNAAHCYTQTLLNGEQTVSIDNYLPCNYVTIITTVDDNGLGTPTTQQFTFPKCKLLTQQIDFITSDTQFAGSPRIAGLTGNGVKGSIYTSGGNEFISDGVGKFYNIKYLGLSFNTVLTAEPNSQQIDSDLVLVNWGQTQQKYYNNGSYSEPVEYSYNGATHIPIYNSEDMFTENTIASTGFAKGYCGSNIKNISIRGIAPKNLEVSVGADEIITFEERAYSPHLSTYNYKGMSNLVSITISPAGHFQSWSTRSFDGLLELSSLTYLQLHSVNVVSTGMLNNDITFINPAGVGAYIYYSGQIGNLNLVNLDTSIVDLDQSAVSHINSTGTSLSTLVIQNCNNSVFYGNTLVTHVDKITLKTSNLVWGTGYYDLTDMTLFRSALHCGVDFNGNSIPTKINTNVGYQDVYGTFGDVIKDEIFISLNNNGLSNGVAFFQYNAFPEQRFGTAEGDPLYRLYYFPTWEDQGQIIGADISIMSNVTGDFDGQVPTINLAGQFPPNATLAWFITNPNSSLLINRAYGTAITNGAGEIISVTTENPGGSYTPSSLHDLVFTGDGFGTASTSAKLAIDNLNTKNWNLQF